MNIISNLGKIPHPYSNDILIAFVILECSLNNEIHIDVLQLSEFALSKFILKDLINNTQNLFTRPSPPIYLLLGNIFYTFKMVVAMTTVDDNTDIVDEDLFLSRAGYAEHRGRWCGSWYFPSATKPFSNPDHQKAEHDDEDDDENTKDDFCN